MKNTDFQLSDEVKEEIKISLKQIEEGNVIEAEEVFKDIRQKFGWK